MTIQDFILTSPPPLDPHDTAEHAPGSFMELHVRHLPVVDADGSLLGMVSEDRVLEATAGPNARIASLSAPDPVFAGPETHIFDAAKKMITHALTTLPIVDEDGRYVGLIRRHDLFERFAAMLSTQESGAIVTLEEDPHDYALSKLVHVIEQNDIRILSIASESAGAATGKIHVTIKLDVRDATRVRHLLEYYGYHVAAVFGDGLEDDDMQWRVEEFMRYLEV